MVDANDMRVPCKHPVQVLRDRSDGQQEYVCGFLSCGVVVEIVKKHGVQK